MKVRLRTTEKILERKIRDAKMFFESKVSDDYKMINYIKGFVAAGILIEPVDHISKGVNVIWLFTAGLNLDGTDIITGGFKMTSREAESIVKCLYNIKIKFDYKND